MKKEKEKENEKEKEKGKGKKEEKEERKSRQIFIYTQRNRRINQKPMILVTYRGWVETRKEIMGGWVRGRNR